MRRAARLLAALFVLAGCEVAPEQPALPSAEEAARAVANPDPDFDGDNLLNLAYGAAVVSRTAEYNLEFSAAHAIDGMTASYWRSPPGGPRQTMTFSLAAPARITGVGISAPENESLTPEGVTFAVSDDGKRWRDLTLIVPVAGIAPRLADVDPVTAAYVRVAVKEPSEYYSALRSIHLLGQEISPPAPRQFEGCWDVGGIAGQFERNGARVWGRIDSKPPMHFEGGTDGRVAMLMWTRGPNWGYAAVTLTPDHDRMTGLMFYEDVAARNLRPAFFGERQPCRQQQPVERISPARLLSRAGRFSVFGLVSGPDQKLMESASRDSIDAIASLAGAASSQRIRVIAHEHRGSSPAENRERAAARVEQIRAALRSRGVDVERIEFVAAGSEGWKGPPLSHALQRLLASRVDVEPAG